MPTVNPGFAPYADFLEVGASLAVVVPAGGGAVVERISASGAMDSTEINEGSVVFGPYPRTSSIKLSPLRKPVSVTRNAAAGGASYTDAQALAAAKAGIPASTLDASTTAQVTTKLKPYLGLIATRGACNVGAAVAGTNAVMSRTGHRARDTTSALRMVLGNWSARAANTDVTVGVTRYTAAFENEAGARVPCTFGGASFIDAADGATVESDDCVIPVTNGSFLKAFWKGIFAGGYLYHSGSTVSFEDNPAMGDLADLGATDVTDVTVSGNPTGRQNQRSFVPLGIVGMTTKASILLIGDSLIAGTGDTNDATGNVGMLARAVGDRYAYCNVSVFGETALNIGTNGARRLAMAKYCSHAIIEPGINEYSQTAATIMSRRLAIRTALKAINPNIIIFDTTLTPYTTSTDGWITEANQTVFNTTSEANRIAFNELLRTSTPQYCSGVIELCDVTESYRNSGKMVPGPTANYFTPDGIHYSRMGYRRFTPAAVLGPMGLL